MTNPIAIFLGLVILTGIVVDLVVYDTEGMLFLARKFADLLEWLAFWR
jgi:hypothetical protein